MSKKTILKLIISIFQIGILINPSISLAARINPYEAEYTVYWKNIRVGTSKHQFKNLGQNKYKAEASTSPNSRLLPFNYYECSEFEISNNSQVIPKSFYFKHYERGKELEGDYHFDWDTQLIIDKLNREKSFGDLRHGTQDSLSHVIQLRTDLISQKGNPSYSYSVAKKHEIDNFNFKIVGDEILETNLGSQKTVVVMHRSEKSQKDTLLWLAPGFDFLMVKMQQYKNKKLNAEVEISSYRKI